MATPLDKLQTTPSGMPQATPPGMPQATPPAIFFQISKIFNFSNNLPQATPPASPQAIFEKNFTLGPCLRQFEKKHSPCGYASGYLKKNIFL
ncbi:hypothetical protein T02_969, partial [Trichinella nativa]